MLAVIEHALTKKVVALHDNLVFHYNEFEILRYSHLFNNNGSHESHLPYLRYNSRSFDATRDEQKEIQHFKCALISE